MAFLSLSLLVTATKSEEKKKAPQHGDDPLARENVDVDGAKVASVKGKTDNQSFAVADFHHNGGANVS